MNHLIKCVYYKASLLKDLFDGMDLTIKDTLELIDYVLICIYCDPLIKDTNSLIKLLENEYI